VSTFSGSIAGGGGAGVDALVVTDGTNAWTVSGANAGTLNVSTSFSGIETLTGGTGTDTLTGPNAATAWSITGANAVTVDGMDASSIEALVGGTGSDTFTLGAGITSFSGSINGGGGAGVDVLAATDGTNDWVITGAKAGILNTTTTFSGIETLTGGSGTDTLTGVGGWQRLEYHRRQGRDGVQHERHLHGRPGGRHRR